MNQKDTIKGCDDQARDLNSYIRRLFGELSSCRRLVELFFLMFVIAPARCGHDWKVILEE